MAEFIVGSALQRLARRHRLLQRLLWRLDFALVWLALHLFRRVPVDAASRLGARLGGRAGFLLKRKSALYRANLARVTPALEATALDALVHQGWRNAGRILAEYPHLGTILEQPERLQINVCEAIARRPPGQRCCVIVTAHLGNWEVIGLAMARLGMPNVCLYSAPTNPLLNQMLLASRRVLQCELLPRENSTRLLLRALQQARTVAMVIDRRVDDGKPVSFFGQPKLSTVMPARLALKCRRELVPVQVERLTDARFRVTLHPPIVPTDPDADESARALDMIEQAHAQFESWIKASPADWLCSKRLWPKPPANVE